MKEQEKAPNNFNVKEVLEYTQLMWTWLADNPTAEKSDYFHAHQGIVHPNNKWDCHLCDFVGYDETGDLQCGGCLLKDHFQSDVLRTPDIEESGVDVGTDGVFCEDCENTSYYRWTYMEDYLDSILNLDDQLNEEVYQTAYKEERTKAAQSLVDACEAAIATLNQ